MTRPSKIDWNCLFIHLIVHRVVNFSFQQVTKDIESTIPVWLLHPAWTRKANSKFKTFSSVRKFVTHQHQAKGSHLVSLFPVTTCYMAKRFQIN